ncbi:MAG: class I SAM-dependent methyltransferase [Rhodospirillaceae bacterium]|jgi:NADH dehydrogenase [ubiquinone] 1 alpha subcomplex assembly factor 7|nr:class I SAM-dependent methyltransferase [Rhodospirillaceae bacterium]MBT5943135.1 class I SAM-dependent methyltransferase [Rhodospirillaceae bacterium]MBT6405066.1 class I SAM-dependent methyltransferase [Rhodospirillaceae bacterium]MBT6535175.1 class I SAM-dependent methyltransferase [Rhodospirillaceae bacterium]MBT7361548.1 class I SAM-dependent methyltransferase [Rhodospirillaceae bacterium]
MDSGQPVVRRLTRLISERGPISVADFMEIALGDPEGGYYATRDPFGVDGDFTTAPEISQMFGELIGLWCADSWQRIGAPEEFALIELGPGRGSLMADALRAISGLPACRAAARIHLVENSATLRDAQQNALRGHDVSWHERVPSLDGLPAIFIANEFLDALPVRQFVKTGKAWRERLVDYDPADDIFTFTPAGAAMPDGPQAGRLLADAAEGDILEESPAVISVVGEIAAHVAAHGGAALFIDYGHRRTAVGETLQAVRQHRPISPLEAPGTCDVTAHVDFQRVVEAAVIAGVRPLGPLDQGVFLQRLGIRERADSLRGKADDRQTRDLNAALTRLIGPTEMGTLFKVMALSEQRIELLAGFDSLS